MGQDLQGHVLKGGGGPVPQLQAGRVPVQGVEGGHLGIVKLPRPIAGLGVGGELLLREILQEELHHGHRPLAVGLAPQVLQHLRGELGQDLGGKQPPVPGQPLGDGLAGGEGNVAVSCADIVHGIHTPLNSLASPLQPGREPLGNDTKTG